MTTSTLERIYEAAAEARAAGGYPAVASRPSERRLDEDGGRGVVAVRGANLQLRAADDSDSDSLHFVGFASVYDRGYDMWDMFGPYTEQVTSGAGAESLANPDLDVPLVLDHVSLRRIARTTNGSLTLSEDTVDGVSGLLVDAPNLDPQDKDVAYIAPKLRAGLVDEMSFRFRITSGQWSPDWTEYHIEAYDIHRGDVAIVGYGANPHTQGAGLRSQALPNLADLTDSQLRQLERDLHALRRSAPAMSRNGIDLLAASLGDAQPI